MLRSVRIIRMAQCVMTSGMSWRPEWSAGNLDTLEMVSKLIYMYIISYGCMN